MGIIPNDLHSILSDTAASEELNPKYFYDILSIFY
jgi:hypothetical protein